MMTHSFANNDGTVAFDARATMNETRVEFILPYNYLCLSSICVDILHKRQARSRPSQ